MAAAAHQDEEPPPSLFAPRCGPEVEVGRRFDGIRSRNTQRGDIFSMFIFYLRLQWSKFKVNHPKENLIECQKAAYLASLQNGLKQCLKNKSFQRVKPGSVCCG